MRISRDDGEGASGHAPSNARTSPQQRRTGAPASGDSAWAVFSFFLLVLGASRLRVLVRRSRQQ
jgi:hypothetical protein